MQLSFVDVTTAAIRNSSSAFLARVANGVGNGVADSAYTITMLSKLEQALAEMVGKSYMIEDGTIVTPITIIDKDDTIPGNAGLVLQVEDWDVGDDTITPSPGDDTQQPGGDDTQTPGGDDTLTPNPGDDTHTPGGDDTLTPNPGDDTQTPGGDDTQTPITLSSIDLSSDVDSSTGNIIVPLSITDDDVSLSTNMVIGIGEPANTEISSDAIPIIITDTEGTASPNTGMALKLGEQVN